ncbi:PF20097 family protein [Ruminococcus flavefaciens]|uniref:PF20097 family protein n=1 Tax=Ruminococcus flavefaciens TaxID=1265 RepID=UPI0004674E89|nr:PF20097 family protein [Ruminococcus flavefaciens]
MKCPYCKKEMELGFIQSPQEISWKKGDKRPLLGRAQFHEGSVILSELSFLKGAAVTAFLCRECKKVIIEYSDENSDFNQR